MFNKLAWVVCLSAILGLSACGGEQKANSNNNNGTPVGLMSQQESDSNEKDTEKTKSSQSKSKKSAEPWSGEAVNINTATPSELQAALKGTGVGKAKVEKIIEYREKNGGFKSVEELNEVKGIGDKTMEKLRERVTVSGGKVADKKEKNENKESTKEEAENNEE